MGGGHPPFIDSVATVLACAAADLCAGRGGALVLVWLLASGLRQNPESYQLRYP